MSFRPVADAELDAKINAEPDEEHGKCHRDQVQCPYHPKADGSRKNESNYKTDQDGQDDTELFQREPQYEDDKKKCHDTVQCGAIGDCGEFFVRKSNRAGEAHPYTPFRRQSQPGNGFADSRSRLAARLQIIEIQNRLNIYEAAK